MSFSAGDPVLIDKKIPGIVMETRPGQIVPSDTEIRVKFIRSRPNHFSREGQRRCLWSFWYPVDRIQRRARLEDEEVFLGEPIEDEMTLQEKMRAAIRLQKEMRAKRRNH